MYIYNYYSIIMKKLLMLVSELDDKKIIDEKILMEFIKDNKVAIETSLNKTPDYRERFINKAIRTNFFTKGHKNCYVSNKEIDLLFKELETNKIGETI